MRSVAILSLCVFLLSGCASKYGTAHTQAYYYPACYRPIQELRASEHDVAKGTAGGAVIGALGGALLGFLSTGKVQGAVVGGVAGAATGAVVGNIYAKKQQIQDENRRMASYLEDLDGDIRHLDIVSASAKASLDCYDQKFQVLLNDIRTRKISRREAEDRFGEIASGRDEAIALLGKAETYGHDLDSQYEQAFVQEEQRIQKRPASRASRSNLSRAKTQKRTLTNRVNTVARQKQSAVSKSQTDSQTFANELKNIDV